MEPLLQLPHTYANIDRRTIISTDFEEKRETNLRSLHAVMGLMVLIELVERGHVTIDTSGAGENPLGEFFVQSLPEELIEAFEHFKSKRFYSDIYDVDDISAFGEFIDKLPSKANNSGESIRRLKDALKGGIDEQTGIFELQDMFP